MFNNIGKKIKGLAKCITWVGIVCSVVIGLTLVNRNLVTGLITAVIGCLGSWISSLVLYGFGELIQNSSIIAEKLDNYRGNISLSYTENDNINVGKIENDDLELKDKDRNYIDIKCPVCSEELSFPENTKTAVCPWCGAAIKL